MKKLLFIFNPLSGKGMISQHLCSICDIFTKAGYEVTVRPTQKKLDSFEYFVKRAEDFDILVSSGGDGTLNETIKAVMTLKTDKPIGYIPAGTMNDFASTLKIPKDMDKAAELIVNSDSPILVDVGAFNDEYFTYVAAFGLFTSVSYETNQQLKNNLGVLAYILEALKSRQLQEAVNDYYHMKVTYDDKVIEDDFIFGMMANSMSVGGFKGITGDDVLLDDGVFEGLLVKHPESLLDLQSTINSLLKKDFSAPCFYYFKSEKATFESDKEIPWTIDGEYGGEQKTVNISNCHKAVNIFSGDSSALENN